MGRDVHKPGTSAQSSVSLAKLSLPRLAQGIARPRLFAMLDEARQRAGTWIAAPGGAGKTTLAATYLIERKLPYLWYQLDKDDADPATFFYYLGIAARQVNPDVHLPLLTPEYLPDIPGFARRYFRDLIARLPAGLVLVLDNYQDLGEAPLFAEMLRNVLEEIRDAHLMILSRSGPAWTGSSAAGALIPLDWETLRLTYDETRAIATHSHALNEISLHALHRRADGWPAGVTLLLEQMESDGSGAAAPDAGATDTVFHFFAGEFFNHLPVTTQDFLLKTALLAHMTPSMAEKLSGNAEAAHILADLHRRHFFVHRRDLDEISYQYHALFREFLLDRMAVGRPHEHYLALTRQTAQILNEYQRHEEAMSLRLQVGDWEIAGHLVLNLAPRLIAQGRGKIVGGWFRQMPDGVVMAKPWLLYWKGISHQFTDPIAAQAILEEACAGFGTAGDVMGQMLATSGIIDIIFFLRQSLFQAVKWITLLQDLLSRNHSFSGPEIEAQVVGSLFSMLELMRPDDPSLHHYAPRLMELLATDIDLNQRVTLAVRLIIYYAVIRGSGETCDEIMIHVRRLIDDPAITGATRIFWKLLSVLPSIYLGHASQVAKEAIKDLLSLAEDGNLDMTLKEQNLLVLEFIGSWYVVLVQLHLKNYQSAGGLLDRMGSLVAEAQSIDMATYSMARSLYALCQGDLLSANHYGRISLQVHCRVGAMITGFDASCILALERCENGNFLEAHEYLEAPKRLGSEYAPLLYQRALFVEAYAYLRQDDLENCHVVLSEAFSMGRHLRIPGYAFWLSKIMPRLCSEALRAGIEREYVKQIIHAHALVPEGVEFDEWPWPVRIYTLGQFKVVLDDREIVYSQSKRKPLALLAMLISLGCSEVKLDRMAEVLWPDAEGDMGLSAFATNLSRLRKLIGDEAITVKDGRASLDERCCWLDTRALERHLARLKLLGEDGKAALNYAVQLLGLYRGPFMGGEKLEWAQQLHCRLRGEVALALVRCIQILRASDAQRDIARILKQIKAADLAIVGLIEAAMAA